MNLKRGFRRITLLLAIVVGIYCAVFGAGIPANKHNRLARQEQLVQEIEAEKSIWAEGELERAEAKLEELEDDFWVTLPVWALVGLCILYGLGYGGVGYCAVWLVYKLIRWLVLGFCGGTG